MKKVMWVLVGPLLTGVLLTACKGKDGDPGPTGPAGPAGPAGPVVPALTGDITGYMQAYDQHGNPMADDSITVKLDGTAYQALTDTTGRFEIKNVKAGTYNATFSRPGFGTIKKPGISHVGGDQPTFLGITGFSQASTTTVSNFAVSTVGMLGYSATIANPTTPSSLRVGIFASDHPNFTPETGTLLVGLYRSQGIVSGTLYPELFSTAGFRPGQQVYLLMCGFPEYLTGYYDSQTGKIVYAGAGQPSNIVSVTAP